MQYGLKIVRKSEGENFRLETCAEGGYAGGTLTLEYECEGARCRLTVTKDKIVNQLNGDICTRAEFVEGRQTPYYFGDGVNGGTFALFTYELKIKLGAFGLSARCVYAYADGANKTVMTVTAFAAKR